MNESSDESTDLINSHNFLTLYRIDVNFYQLFLKILSVYNI